MVIYGETFYRRHTALTPAAVKPPTDKEISAATEDESGNGH